MTRVLTVLLLGICLSCSKVDGPATQEHTTTPVSVPYPYATTNFQFYYTSYDSASIRLIGDTLQNHYQRIVTDLNSDSLPKVQVHFYKTYDELFDAVRSIVPNLPPWAIGLATAQDQIHLISPRHPDRDFQWMLVNLIHEFAHCVSLHVKPNFGNNPRWLWESVAIYEASQFVHPSNLPYLVNQTPPTITQLNGFDNTYIYDVGCFLSEYIIANFGKPKLNELIRNNGNIQASLGMNSMQFQSAWFAFVKTRYGI